MKKNRPRILFVAEAVTLAHVVRPRVLADALNSERYEVHFATDPRYNRLFPDGGHNQYSIESITSQQFLDALRNGKPVYEKNTLISYVEDDLKLLIHIKPDLVVGDFRLSLAVSAELAGIPYANIINAYWSPHTRLQFTVPELPFVRFTGPHLANILFRFARPLAFAYHALPLNLVRHHYNLPFLGLDLRCIYSHADYVLYPDIAELIPIEDLPRTHHYLGPILWSPSTSMPKWWGEWPSDRPIVYVNLGSSGPIELLSSIFEAAGDLPITLIVATAGRIRFENVPKNILLSEFLPGDLAAKKSRFVICNGGSLATQQALIAGVPILGFPSNLDQFLNMQSLVAAGVGLSIRPSQVSVDKLKEVMIDMLQNSGYARSATKLTRILEKYDSQARFGVFIEEFLDRENEHVKT